VRIGYARTSTIDQAAGFEAQIKELEGAGCEKIFQEQVSSMAQRPQLEAALDYIRDGDTLVVSKLDRLARSTQNLLEITERMRRKGANLHVLNLGMDTGTATGKLLLTVIGAIGQFEREMMLERQREGIAKAKASGKYKGRKPTAQAQAAEVQRLRREGIGPTEIAKRVGIARASVYRIIRGQASRTPFAVHSGLRGARSPQARPRGVKAPLAL
jgi:DNA invertase Pin-like site-specific DNA recombinase